MHGHENKHGLVIKAHTGGIRRERGDRGDRALGREVGAGSCSWPLLRCVTWSKSHLLSVPFLSGCQVGGWPCPSSQAGRKAGSALFPMSQPPGSRGEGSPCSWDTGTAPVPGTRGQPLSRPPGRHRKELCRVTETGQRLREAGCFSRGWWQSWNGSAGPKHHHPGSWSVGGSATAASSAFVLSPAHCPPQRYQRSSRSSQNAPVSSQDAFKKLLRAPARCFCHNKLQALKLLFPATSELLSWRARKTHLRGSRLPLELQVFSGAPRAGTAPAEVSLWLRERLSGMGIGASPGERCGHGDSHAKHKP